MQCALTPPLVPYTLNGGRAGAETSLKIIALQSGSCGNCIYVESGRTRLLIDAGISGRQASLRLAAHGVDIHTVQAVVISHEHADHIKCAGIYQRKFHAAIHVSKATLDAARRYRNLGSLDAVKYFTPGDAISFSDVRVETIPTPHDGIESTAFVVQDDRYRIGILTDLGNVFAGLPDIVSSLDAVLLESNYDPTMLERGPYPPALKKRITGENGHISNIDSAELIQTAASSKLRWVCLSHLSEQNNSPNIALQTHLRYLTGRVKVGLYVASRYEAVALPEL